MILLTEKKVYTNSSIKLMRYQLFPAVRSKRQGGGILVAIKYGLYSSIMVDKGNETEFITVCLRFDYQHIRLVLMKMTLSIRYETFMTALVFKLKGQI